MSGDPNSFGSAIAGHEHDRLLTPERVAKRLNTSIDWVWDHSSRKLPLLPVIRIGDGPGRAGILRYRASKIEEFIIEQERLSALRRTGKMKASGEESGHFQILAFSIQRN
jgi:hypothetical protein